MVHGAIIGVSTLLRPSLDFGLLGQHSIAQCALPSGPSGRTGKTVLPSSLARNPASTIRRTFRSTAASQNDPSARVRFSSDRAPSQQGVLDSWRTHFSTVGSSGSSLEGAIFQSVSTRFDEIVSSPIIPALFDAPIFLI